MYSFRSISYIISYTCQPAPTNQRSGFLGASMQEEEEEAHKLARTIYNHGLKNISFLNIFFRKQTCCCMTIPRNGVPAEIVNKLFSLSSPSSCLSIPIAPTGQTDDDSKHSCCFFFRHTLKWPELVVVT